MNRYWQIILTGFAVLALAAIYVMAGEMDYQDAKLEEKSSVIEYCWRVEAGVHRDWDKEVNCAGMVQVAGAMK